jgi:hypothetical protein
MSQTRIYTLLSILNFLAVFFPFDISIFFYAFAIGIAGLTLEKNFKTASAFLAAAVFLHYLGFENYAIACNFVFFSVACYYEYKEGNSNANE